MLSPEAAPVSVVWARCCIDSFMWSMRVACWPRLFSLNKNSSVLWRLWCESQSAVSEGQTTVQCSVFPWNLSLCLGRLGWEILALSPSSHYRKFPVSVLGYISVSLLDLSNYLFFLHDFPCFSLFIVNLIGCCIRPLSVLILLLQPIQNKGLNKAELKIPIVSSNIQFLWNPRYYYSTVFRTKFPVSVH